MNLEDELDAFRTASDAKRSEEERAERRRGAKALSQSGIAEAARRRGDPFPSFVLLNATGTEVRTADLLATGPMIVVFYRGGWCPYCNLELRAWQRRLTEVREANATLIAISPELPDHSLSTAEKNELAFLVLSDRDQRVARELGIVHSLPEQTVARQKGKGIDVAARQGSSRATLPLPATYVIDPSGTIRYAFVETDYTQRAEPAAVLEALRALP
ncbi:MAG: peroxiredoxin-like family protein [Myxococcota bacterium]